MEKVVTYILKMIVDKNFEVGEIHRSLEEAAASAFHYVAGYDSVKMAEELECLMINWEADLGDLIWEAPQHNIKLILSQYVAKHHYRENNDCKIIKFRKAA